MSATSESFVERDSMLHLKLPNGKEVRVYVLFLLTSVFPLLDEWKATKHPVFCDFEYGEHEVQVFSFMVGDAVLIYVRKDKKERPHRSVRTFLSTGEIALWGWGVDSDIHLLKEERFYPNIIDLQRILLPQFGRKISLEVAFESYTGDVLDKGLRSTRNWFPISSSMVEYCVNDLMAISTIFHLAVMLKEPIAIKPIEIREASNYHLAVMDRQVFLSDMKKSGKSPTASLTELALILIHYIHPGINEAETAQLAYTSVTQMFKEGFIVRKGAYYHIPDDKQERIQMSMSQAVAVVKLLSLAVQPVWKAESDIVTTIRNIRPSTQIETAWKSVDALMDHGCLHWDGFLLSC